MSFLFLISFLLLFLMIYIINYPLINFYCYLIFYKHNGLKKMQNWILEQKEMYGTFSWDWENNFPQFVFSIYTSKNGAGKFVGWCWPTSTPSLVCQQVGWRSWPSVNFLLTTVTPIHDRPVVRWQHQNADEYSILSTVYFVVT